VILPLSDVLYNQDEYTPINSQYAIGIHGYILVYSITSKNSFNMIQGVYDKILDFCGLPKIACVIVGSKSDLNMSYVIFGLVPSEFVSDPIS
jgi:GTPase SAR1 family protein